MVYKKLNSTEPGRPGRRDPLGTGQLDEESSSTLDGGHGSNVIQKRAWRRSTAISSKPTAISSKPTHYKRAPL